MKTSVLSFIALALLFVAASCSSPSEDTNTTAISNENVIESTRGVDAAGDDMNVMLARKWQNESAYVDLKIDGSFEGNLDGETELIGKWSISDDQKTLKLMEEQTLEGKGTSFHAEFVLVDITPNTMKVLDQDGNELTFSAN